MERKWGFTEACRAPRPWQGRGQRAGREKAASGSASSRLPPVSAVTWETDLGVGGKVERGR